MIRRIFSIALFVFLAVLALAQQNGEIKVNTVRLDNGLKVVMAEDHTSPEIYGCVYVHAGSKNDPEDATGCAHYFEHMMFKGTDRIGTTNWNAEKVFLDSISLKYDELSQTTDPEGRKAIQREINRLSIAASAYAIPNEVDVILSQMGGTGLNAGTSYDMTVYYNKFPSNTLGSWLEVYAERFRNPVFRLFQSELETVYEEKNMYQDQPTTVFMESMFKESFGEHPYGRPVIGYGEHLKNPQLSRMQQFFNTYYVANNMTLMLVGDFRTDEALAMVKRYFGNMRTGEVPKMRQYTMPEFKGQMVKEVKMTPIKMGLLIYKGVENSHQDQLELGVLSELLFNGGSGLLDKAQNDGEIMAALMLPLSLEDAGVNIFLYIPKVIGQSHEQAEAVVLRCLDSVKQGRFSDDLFEAIRTDLLVSYQKRVESAGDLFGLLQELEGSGQTYRDYLNDIERLRRLTKDDIVKIANKYFGNDFLCYRSKMGFPAKDQVDKPDWKPIEAQNVGEKSDFAKVISSREFPECKPQNIVFGKDVVIGEANKNFPIYSAKNPRNDIFNLQVSYRYGSLQDPDLGRAISYWDYQGTQKRNIQDFNIALQKLGGSLNISVDDLYTTLNITGLEQNMDAIVKLCCEKIFTPANDEAKRNLIVEEVQSEEKMFKGSVSEWSNALYEYVLYGDKSAYLTKTPIKQWSKRSGTDLIAEMSRIFDYAGYINFTGNSDPERVSALLRANKLIKTDALEGTKELRPKNQYNENVVFTAHNKKFNQSNIDFCVPSSNMTREEEAMSQLFNKYFGSDMYSIVFQEIREFRSLGYTAYGYVRQDYLHRQPAELYCYLGTQSDKTIDGIDAMTSLIRDLPERRDKFDAAKSALLKSRSSSYINFRNMPYQVAIWQEMGYKSDPRQQNTEIIRHANYEDVVAFFNKFIANRPIVTVIAGNMKRVNAKDLAKHGKVTEVKSSKIAIF